MDKKITLPLTHEVMVEYFKDKSIVYEIDLDETLKALNERSLLLYISNLGVKCTFDKITDDLLLEYMTLKEFCDSMTLRAIHANVLHLAKYGEVAYEEFLDMYSFEQMKSFIESNIDVVAEQLMFLDSMMLYILTRESEDGERVIASEQTYTTNIDETLHDEIGYNVISLFRLPDFLIIFSQKVPDLTEQTYYTRYFDEYMFGGKNLFAYATHNSYFGLIALLSHCREDVELNKRVTRLYEDTVAALEARENDTK